MGVADQWRGGGKGAADPTSSWLWRPSTAAAAAATTTPKSSEGKPRAPEAGEIQAEQACNEFGDSRGASGRCVEEEEEEEEDRDREQEHEVVDAWYLVAVDEDQEFYSRWRPKRSSLEKEIRMKNDE